MVYDNDIPRLRSRFKGAWATRLLSFLLFFLFLSFPGEPQADTQKTLEKVSLQLKWLHHFQFAGYYAAVEKGFYQDVGLDVELIEGGPGINFVNEVVSGRANYGVELPGLMIERSKGKPVVTLAAIFQHSPLMLVMRQDSGIETPQDIRGRSVMLRYSSDAELLAMFIAEGVPLKSIEIGELSWNLKDLIDGKVDAIHGYLTNEPFALQQKGIPYTLLRPQTYGVDFYGDVLFTSEAEIAENPKRVQKFRKASLQGWAYAMENPEEIIDLILAKYNPKFSKESMLYEAKIIRQLMLPDLVEIGHLNPGRWKHIGDTFVKLNMLPADYSLDTFLYDSNPKPDYSWAYWGFGLLITGVTLISMWTIVLTGFNRRLQQSVTNRTRELIDTNTELRTEIEERTRVEQALHKSEERFRDFAETASDWFWEMDADLNFTYISERIYDITGRKPQELYGLSRKSFVNPKTEDVNPGVWQQHFRQLDNREPFRNFEYYVDAADNKIVRVSINGDPVFSEEGKFLGYRGTGIDISERKQLEKQLRQSQKMEVVGQLTGGVAHDFNNLLAVMIGNAEMLEERISDDPIAIHNIEALKKAVDRATSLTNRLLAFSRQQTLSPVSTNIPDLVNGLDEMLTRTLGETVDLKVVTNPGLWNAIIDPHQFENALINLAINARDAMPQGGSLLIEADNATLDASYVAHNEEVAAGDYVRISVTDTGTGIPPEVLDKVFDPFFTTKEVGKGSGLGLSMVFGFAKQSKGHVSIYSDVGHGTTVKLYIPRSPENGPNKSVNHKELSQSEK